MSQLLSQVDVLLTLAPNDRVVVYDIDEPLASKRVKTVAISTLTSFISNQVGFSRRIITGSGTLLTSDRLVAVRLASAATVNLALPDGDLFVGTDLQPYKITIKDEGATADVATPINITPFAGNTIEGQASVSITNARGSLSLYFVPLNNEWKVVYG